MRRHLMSLAVARSERSRIPEPESEEPPAIQEPEDDDTTVELVLEAEIESSVPESESEPPQVTPCEHIQESVPAEPYAHHCLPPVVVQEPICMPVLESKPTLPIGERLLASPYTLIGILAFGLFLSRR